MDNHKKQKDALDYVMDCMCASHDVRERNVTGCVHSTFLSGEHVWQTDTGQLYVMKYQKTVQTSEKSSGIFHYFKWMILCTN